MRSHYFIVFLFLLPLAQLRGQNCVYTAYEGFTYSGNLALNGLSGSSGWAGPWVVQNESNAVPGYQTSTGANLSFGALQTLGNYASGGSQFLTSGRRMNTSESGPFAAYVGQGGDAIGQVTNGGVLFFSVLLRKEADNSDPVFATLHGDNIPWCHNCSSQRIGVGYFGSASDVGNQRRWSLQVGSSVFTTNVQVAAGQSVFLVLRLAFNPVGTQASLFINPAQLGSGSLGTAQVTQTSASPFNLRSLAVFLGNSSGQGSIDEVRFAPSYACVAPDAGVVVNVPPVAVISASPTTGQAPLLVSFDGSGSFDPEGQTLTYSWNFGDGSPLGQSAIMQHTYTSAYGALPVTLTVSDPSGQQITATTTINILDANGTFSCQPTITCVAKASCGQNNGVLRINVENGTTATLLQNGNALPTQPNNQYANLAPGPYTVQVSGPNGCSNTYPVFMLVDSTTCAGWQPDPCAMKVGMNLTGIADWSTERPFKNLLKNTRPEPFAFAEGCFCFSTPGLLELMTFDAEGYPTHAPQTTALGNGQFRYTISSDGGNLVEGQQYVVLYDGTGTVGIDGTAQLLTSTPGRLTFTAGNGNIFITILQSNGANRVRNIRVLRLADEFADLSAQPFYEGFLAKIEPYNTLRFMDWGATNNNPMVNWSERTLTGRFSYGSPQGVPYEMMIRLANQTDKDLWVCVPHQASNDFITQMATLFRDQLESERTIYLEYSNEVWNWIFEQANFNNDNRPANLMYGRAMAERAKNVFSIWHSVFAGQTSRVKRVLGLQGGFNYLNENILAQLSPNEWDFGSPTHYFGLDHESTGQPVLGANSTVADVMANAQNAFLDFKESVKQDYRNVQVFGKQVITYEGGQHFVGNVFGIGYPYQQSMWDAQYSPLMYNMYRQVHDSIASWGCRLAMNFSNAGPQESIYGSWGVLSDIDQQPPFSTTAPKYQALLDIVAECPVLPVSTKGENEISLTPAIYPNPNNGRFILKINQQQHVGPYQILDATGRTVWQGWPMNGQFAVNLQSGLYTLVRCHDDEKPVTARFVVTQ